MNRATKIMLILVSMLMLCSCVLRKEEEDGSFHDKTSDVIGGSGSVARYIIRISAAQAQVNVSETSSIQFSMGLGHFPTNNPKAHHAWIIITAENCIINGEKDVLRKDYADFFQNDIYVYEEGEATLFGLGSIPLYPQYYETIEISFPQQDCSGAVSIELFSTHEMDFTGREDAATVLTFRYTVKNGVLTLIEK